MTTPIDHNKRAGAEILQEPSKKPQDATEDSSLSERTSAAAQGALDSFPLLQMPLELVGCIAGFLNAKDLTNFKKTCRATRDKIDELCPENGYIDSSIFLENLERLILNAIETKNDPFLLGLSKLLAKDHIELARAIKKHITDPTLKKFITRLIIARELITTDFEGACKYFSKAAKFVSLKRMEGEYTCTWNECERYALDMIKAIPAKNLSQLTELKTLIDSVGPGYGSDDSSTFFTEIAQKLAQNYPDEALLFWKNAFTKAKNENCMVYEIQKVSEIIKNIARDFPEKFPQFLDLMKEMKNHLLSLSLIGNVEPNPNEECAAELLIEKASAYNPENVSLLLKSSLEDEVSDSNKYKTIKKVMFLKGNNAEMAQNCVKVVESMKDALYKFLALTQIAFQLALVDPQRSYELLEKSLLILKDFQEDEQPASLDLIAQTLEAHIESRPESLEPLLQLVKQAQRKMASPSIKKELQAMIERIDPATKEKAVEKMIEELSSVRRRDSPTAKGRQVSCRSRVDSPANSAVNDRDCARATVHKDRKIAKMMSINPSKGIRMLQSFLRSFTDCHLDTKSIAQTVSLLEGLLELLRKNPSEAFYNHRHELFYEICKLPLPFQAVLFLNILESYKEPTTTKIYIKKGLENLTQAVKDFVPPPSPLSSLAL